MDKRLEKVRRKIENRRRDAHGNVKRKERSAPIIYDRHDEARDEPDFYVYQEKQEDKQESLFNKEWFMLRSMMAVLLFLGTAILFSNQSQALDGARAFIKNSYEQEFQFSAIANWYENQFGRPLALLPYENDMALHDVDETPDLAYAVPASGVVTESFQQNGRGILVETGKDKRVEAVKAGVVIFVGEEDNLGKTIGIRHYDDEGESWYGMLSDVDVQLYDTVTSGSEIGKVSSNEQAEKGIYYFALKQGEQYIDPIDVISFD